MAMTGTDQPGLFDPTDTDSKIDEAVLYALGEFQERGFELEGRTLALDRLLGAFRRAFDEFDIRSLPDSEIAEHLRAAGADVEELPPYVAKHPFRITVRKKLSDRSLEFYKDFVSGPKAERA